MSNTPLVKGSSDGTMMGVLHLPLGAEMGMGGGAGTAGTKQAGNLLARSCTCCFMLATTRSGRRPQGWLCPKVRAMLLKPPAT